MFFPTLCHGDMLVVNKKTEIIYMPFFFEARVDSTNPKTFQEVLNDSSLFDLHLNNHKYWTNYAENKLYTYWLKFSLKNSDTTDMAVFYFEGFSYHHKKTWFYIPNEKGGYSVDSMGFDLPFYTRSIHHKNPELLVTIPPGETRTYFLKIHNWGRTWPYYILRQHNKFISYTLQENYEKGLFLGFFLFVILLNLFFFFALKEQSYLYYMFFVIFEVLFVLTDGFGFQYFWPNLPWINIYIPRISQFGLIISLILFTNYFLGTRNRIPFQYYFFLILIVLRTILFIYGELKHTDMYEITANINSRLFDNILLLLLSIPIIYMAKKERVASNYYFLLAHIFFAIGFYQVTLQGSKVMPDFLMHFAEWITGTWMFGFFFHIFAMFHLIFVSVALVERIKYLKSDNEKNQKNLILQLKENKLIQEEINQKLEIKVIERTEEINQKKEEIIAQNEELYKQSFELEDRAQKIDSLYKEVTESIETAKFIQDSILPSDEVLKKHLPQCFIFYKPKNIVSGDFYWFHHKNELIYLAVVDCTGHGVAGAFMSLVGFNILNQIIEKDEIISAAEVLNQLSSRLVKSLNQDKEGAMSKDGMDIAFCIIDKKSRNIEFAGANSPL